MKGNKICPLAIFSEILKLLPQTKKKKIIFKRISTFPVIFWFDKKDRRTNKDKDWLVLLQWQRLSWKQESGDFSFVPFSLPLPPSLPSSTPPPSPTAPPRPLPGGTEAGTALLFICQETAHKGFLLGRGSLFSSSYSLMSTAFKNSLPTVILLCPHDPCLFLIYHMFHVLPC